MKEHDIPVISLSLRYDLYYIERRIGLVCVCVSELESMGGGGGGGGAALRPFYETFNFLCMYIYTLKYIYIPNTHR